MNNGTLIALGAGVLSWLGLGLYAWLLISRTRQLAQSEADAPAEAPTVTVRDA